MLNKKAYYFLFAFIVLIIATFFSFWVGHYEISCSELFDIVVKSFSFSNEHSSQTLKNHSMILFEIRFPRIIAAILIGASLSVSGAVFQGMFVNPLVSPSILGVLSGASFGAALGMLFKSSLAAVQLYAFLFGCLAVFFALFISRFYGNTNRIFMLVLGGIISSSLFSSFLSIIKYIADPYNTLPSIVYWLMGSLSVVSLHSVLLLAPLMLGGMIVLIFLGKYIDILSLGEDEAYSLGVDVKKAQLLIIFLATLLSALSVMLAGVIGWIGLVVPHIARFLVGANHQVLVPFSALIGGSFLLIVDSISRGLFPVEVPLGILTSLVGIPVFILVLRYRVKH